MNLFAIRLDPRTQRIAIAIVLFVAARGFAAAATPLSFDEAYYWLWSKHLAAGYYDHPPAIAFVIRAGTAIFGDSSLGVRFVPFILSAAASWAVWRTGAILFENEYLGALAALYFNAMPMVGIEALVATPDAPQMAAAAFLLYALAKVAGSGHDPAWIAANEAEGLSPPKNPSEPRWWIVAGIAGGFALLSKYTAFFLAAGVLFWLAAPWHRRRLRSFWPYLGAGIALAMFAPVLVWNAEHGWISLATQFGRVGAVGFTARYLGEFLAGQFGLASPFIFILGIAGIVALTRSPARRASPLALSAAIAAPAIAYFLWHSLHDRVQGNWPSFLYPAFAIAAAMPAYLARDAWPGKRLRWTRRLAVPVAGAMTALIYAQGIWGVVPVVRDPVSRLLAVGIERVAMDIEILRAQEGANAIVTTGYAPAGLLAFYLPSHPPVVQLNERYRWVNEPPPPASLFDGPLLYVTEIRNDQSARLKERFAEVEPLALIARYRNGAELEEFMVYRVAALRGDPFF